MKYSLEPLSSGEFTIRHNTLDEKLHPAGLKFESEKIYVEQSLLEKRLKFESPVVLFDIGLGAASNACAALDKWAFLQSNGSQKENDQRLADFHLVSFENDLEILEFTLENCTHFPHLFKWQELAKELLVDKRVRRQGLTWELRSGDLGETLFKQDLPLADIIFHDPYSTSKNPDLWSYRIFRRLKKLAKLQSILITYSQATPVRAALLASGFFVGSGAGTGMKRESTLASPYRTLIANPLHENNWMQKWERSGKQFPVDVQDEESRRQFTRALKTQLLSL